MTKLSVGVGIQLVKLVLEMRGYVHLGGISKFGIHFPCKRNDFLGKEWSWFDGRASSVVRVMVFLYAVGDSGIRGVCKKDEAHGEQDRKMVWLDKRGAVHAICMACVDLNRR